METVSPFFILTNVASRIDSASLRSSPAVQILDIVIERYGCPDDQNVQRRKTRSPRRNNFRILAVPPDLTAQPVSVLIQDPVGRN
jgi:hypothetical protein